MILEDYIFRKHSQAGDSEIKKKISRPKGLGTSVVAELGDERGIGTWE